MPTLKSLDEAAASAGVSRRLLQKWVSEGKLTAYRIAGDRKRYVDLEAVRKLRQPEALPKPEPPPPKPEPGVDPPPMP